MQKTVSMALSNSLHYWPELLKQLVDTGDGLLLVKRRHISFPWSAGIYLFTAYIGSHARAVATTISKVAISVGDTRLLALVSARIAMVTTAL